MFEQFGIINPWIYIAGAFMIVIAPGPNSLYVLKTSVLDGRRAGCAGLLAVLIGDAVLIFLAYLGVAAMIKSHPLAFSMVKIGGGIYLAWIGAKVIWNTFFVKRAKPAGTAAELSVSEQTKPTQGTALRAFRTALGLSLTNPKSILFYVSFFVQFIDSSYAHPGISYFILAMILESFSVMWFAVLITLGAALLRSLARVPSLRKLGNTALGSLFLFFASKLVLDA